MKQAFFLIIVGMVIFSASRGSAGECMKVTFLNPDGKGNIFWDLQTSFIQAAADDLGVDLTVVYSPGSNRFEYGRLATTVLTASEKPDYFITIFKKDYSENILEMAEKNGVRIFTINTDVPPEKKQAIGQPRGRYKHWIGQMVPDDTLAGYQLGTLLMEKAEKKELKAKDAKFHMIGMSGSRDSSAALDRNEGLKRASEENPETVLHQIVFTNWDQDETRNRVCRLFDRYPGVSLIWCASDGIAMGAIEAIETKGKIPGKDILTGGIDWSGKGLQAVKEGKMLATFGGHFMEGGLALVLLYDYHHGSDFAGDTGTRIKTRLTAITSDSVQAYESKLNPETWPKIDFKHLSKTYNSKRKKYNFDIGAIFGK